jgi:CTP synthase
MQVVGTSPDGGLVEVVGLPGHPWFVAVQFHPEFKSQPARPHPLFAGFVEAAVGRHKARSDRAAKADASQPAASAGQSGPADSRVPVGASKE